MPRKPKSTALARMDAVERQMGFVNSIIGVGELGADKRLGGTGTNAATRFTNSVMGPTEALGLWRGNDMAARIIEDVPNEMAREGWDVLVAGDREASEDMGALHDELGIPEVFCLAEKRARAEGGALIVLGANDGQAMDQPLILDRVRSMEWLNVVGVDDVGVWSRYENPAERKFGKPLLYQAKTVTSAKGRIAPATYIHESRVLRFDGVVIGGPKWQAANNSDGWGDSVLMRVWNVLRDFEMTWASAAILMTEFAQGVFKFKNLAELMAADNDGAVIARMRMTNLSKSLTNSLIMDSEETFERVVTPLSGVPEVLQQFALRLSAAADMPVSRLMGQSPAGLNATGDADIRFWFDRIAAKQNRDWRPKLNIVTRCLWSQLMAGKEPENWTLKFRPLWQLTAKEQADVRFTMAQADEKNIMSQIYTPEEAARSRFGGDDFSCDTNLDLETREKLATAIAASENEVDPETALNGAQVASMLEIVKLVATGQIPREAGIAMLAAAFPVDEKQANKIMGSAGQGFVPAVAPAPAAPAAPQNRQQLLNANNA